METYTKHFDKSSIKKISDKLNVSEKIIEILFNRGIYTESEIKKFLFPSANDLYNPYLFSQMRTAVKRIVAAIKNKEKILVFGDKDADGITSTAILFRTLKGHGADIIYKISEPDDDYDINDKTADYAVSEKISLVITVDCAIKAFEVITKLKKSGIDCIITDHHEADTVLPDAHSIINAKLINETYPEKNLAGCGTAFKLSSAIVLYYINPEIINDTQLYETIKNDFKYELFLNEFLPVAAIGSIADIVPLTGENRTITKLGYDIIKNNPPFFIESILKQTKTNEINGNTIGYKIVPLINSTRRMRKPEFSLKIILEQNKSSITKLAQQLNELNDLRKIIVDEYFEKIFLDAEKELETENSKVLVLSYEDIEHGFTGLIANKIKEIFNRPVFIFLIDGDTAGGACRSVEGINILNILEQMNHLLISYGGHKYAAGLNIKTENIQKFKTEINNYFTNNNIVPEKAAIKTDLFLDIKEINNGLFEELKLFEPYGNSNEEPVMFSESINISSVNTMGKDNKHLNVYLDTIDRKRAVGWNLGDKVNSLKQSENISLAYTLKLNNFNNKQKIELNILDIFP